MNSDRNSGSKNRISGFLREKLGKQQWIVLLLLASFVGDRTSGIAEDRYSPTEYSAEGQYTEYGGDTIYS